MASRSDTDRLVAGKNAAVRLARRDLAAFWATLDLTDPAAAWVALQEFIPLLTARYGEHAAVIAADWYDRLRMRAVSKGGYRATIGAPAADALTGRLDKLGHLIARPDMLANMLGLLVGEWVNRHVGETIQQSAAADPGRPRVARVPTGSETCAWCLMLASRGAVYASKATALAASHGDCDCVLTVMWDGDRMPKGYDPDALYRQYAKARAAAGGDPKAIAAELRTSLGIR